MIDTLDDIIAIQLAWFPSFSFSVAYAGPIFSICNVWIKAFTTAMQ